MNKQTTLERANADYDHTLIQNILKINSIMSDALGIGIPGADPTENITTATREYSGSEARNLHRSLDVVGRIIDAPAADALRNGFELHTPGYEKLGIPEMLMEKLSDLEFYKKAFRWLIDTRLYNRGGLMYPIVSELGMDHSRTYLSRPLKKTDIECVKSLNVIPQEMISFTIQNYDPHAVGFGEIDELFIQGKPLNFNRIHHYIEGLDIYRTRGISMLDRIVVGAKGLAVAEWTIQNLLLRYRALLIKYPAAEAVSQTPARQSALHKLMDKIKNQFSSKSVAAVPSNYEFQYLQTQLTGLKEATDFLYQYLATVSGVPQSKIKGSAQGELASSQEDERKYNESVRAFEQEGKLKSLIEFLVPFLLWERKGKIFKTLFDNGIHPDDVKVEIEFNPLQSVNPMQDAQIDLINAQTDAANIQNGIITPEEAREERYPEKENFVPPDIEEGSQFANKSLEEMEQYFKQLP